MGFKVLKLDTSNFVRWQPDPDDLKATLEGYRDSVLSGRNKEDILFEVILKLGLDPSKKYDEIECDGKTIYSVGQGALMVCLDDNIKNTRVAERMIALHKELDPIAWKVVFRDNGFVSDDVKTNTKEVLKIAGVSPEEFLTL
jgi:adenine-specific DNA-methyltransferase